MALSLAGARMPVAAAPSERERVSGAPPIRPGRPASSESDG